MATEAELLVEHKRRREHPSSVYEPGNVEGWDQLAFHKSTDRYRLLFGGNQSGKSRAAAFEISCWLRGEHPYRRVPSAPTQVWCISAEYSTLEAGIYRHLCDTLEGPGLIPDWEIERLGPKIPGHDLPSFVELKIGSRVTFKSAKGGEDARMKFQAAAIHLISIDEEIDVAAWIELKMRTLATGGNFIISATLVESYDWIVELEDRADKGVKGYFVTRLHTEKNPYLDTETVVAIKADLSKDELEVRYYGKSRRSIGLVYNTFSEQRHVCKPFPIPQNWTRWMALDPGIRTFAGLWIAISPDNKACAYREIYEHNSPLWEVARTIKAAEGWKFNQGLTETFGHYVFEEADGCEYIARRVIDDKPGSRLVTGDQGVMDQLHERYGILTTPADKSKRPGIEECRHWLENDFKVFSTCENFIQEIKRYRIRSAETKRDRNEPIDEPVKKQDHLMDCWRYIAMERPVYEVEHLPETLRPRMLYGSAAIEERLRKKAPLLEGDWIGV